MKGRADARKTGTEGRATSSTVTCYGCLYEGLDPALAVSDQNAYGPDGHRAPVALQSVHCAAEVRVAARLSDSLDTFLFNEPQKGPFSSAQGPAQPASACRMLFEYRYRARHGADTLAPASFTGSAPTNLLPTASLRTSLYIAFVFHQNSAPAPLYRSRRIAKVSLCRAAQRGPRS